MNKTIKTLFVVAAMMIPGTVMFGQTTIPIPKSEQFKPVTRPKAPAKESVYMTYDPCAGTCTFSMSPAIESMQVLIENRDVGLVIFDEVTQEYPVIEAMLPAGSYSITLVDDKNENMLLNT